jgi:hypothetical protein
MFKIRPNYKIKFAHDESENARKEVDILIFTCKSLGIPVYKQTNRYDPQYPYPTWDREEISQNKLSSRINSQEVIVTSALEFLSHFDEAMTPQPQPITIKINSSYDAVLTPTKDGEVTITVGCQTIPVQVIKEISEALVKLQSRK